MAEYARRLVYLLLVPGVFVGLWVYANATRNANKPMRATWTTASGQKVTGDPYGPADAPTPAFSAELAKVDPSDAVSE